MEYLVFGICVPLKMVVVEVEVVVVVVVVEVGTNLQSSAIH